MPGTPRTCLHLTAQDGAWPRIRRRSPRTQMDIAEALVWVPRNAAAHSARGHTRHASSSTVKRVSQPLRALDRPVRRVLPAVRILRSPSSGLLARGVRYGLAGAAVALIHLSTTTVLAEVVRIPFQIALAIGFSVALIVHFTLQRLFYGAIRRSSRCLCITRSVAILRLPERSTA